MDTSNAILINKVRKSFCNIGLNFNLQENGDELLETHTINPTVFINSTASSNYGYYDFHDGEDGYWYGFMRRLLTATPLRKCNPKYGVGQKNTPRISRSRTSTFSRVKLCAGNAGSITGEK